MPLTDLEIRRSKPREKPYTLSDGNGLSLLVEPNGSKGGRFRYRFDGKPKMLSLGTYPTISLADARQKRDDAKKLVAAAINPSEVRTQESCLVSCSCFLPQGQGKWEERSRGV